MKIGKEQGAKFCLKEIFLIKLIYGNGWVPQVKRYWEWKREYN